MAVSVTTTLFLCSTMAIAQGDVDVNARLRGSTDKTAPRNIIDVKGDPDGRRTIVLDDDVAMPNVGEPLVIPATERFDGVLGIVTHAQALPGRRLKVTTRPTTLDQAYAKLNVELQDASLRELDPEAAASLAGFECTASGNEFSVDPTYSGLTPEFAFSLWRREVLLRLRGTVKLGVGLKFKGQASCKYAGNAQVDIPISGTPVLITLKPAFEASASGAIDSGFDWAPRVSLGFEKNSDRTQSFHEIDLNPSSLGIRQPVGQAQAAMFLGADMDVTVAGRAGVRGVAGPAVALEVKPQGTSVCTAADGYMHADLTAFADVFIKHWEAKIADGDFGRQQLFNRCFP